MSEEEIIKAAEDYCRTCNYKIDSLEEGTAIDAFLAGVKWSKEVNHL